LSSNHPLLELAELELAAFNILVTYSSSIHPFYVFLYIPHSFSLHAIPYFQNTKTNTPITSGPRSHPNVSPQISLPIPSYATFSYCELLYSQFLQMLSTSEFCSFNTSSKIAPSSQAPRFNYQVGRGPQNMTFMNPALSSLPVNKTGTQMLENKSMQQVKPTHLSLQQAIQSCKPYLQQVIHSKSSPSLQQVIHASLQDHSSNLPPIPTCISHLVFPFVLWFLTFIKSIY
jgi:hypothetical protein